MSDERPFVAGPARESIWPDFDPNWIHEEGEGFVVFAKPTGIATIAAAREDEDGLIERAQLYLRRHRIGVTTLHPVQRLDAETSGVLIAATNTASARRLTDAFASRKVEKTYVAAVQTSSSERLDGRWLEHNLQFSGGRSTVVPSGGKPARSHVRVLNRRADRTLLSLQLETGRTHQLRVQLAHEGAPIVGDGLYGGAPASRMMLHAHQLTIAEMGLSFCVEVPDGFASWLEGTNDSELPENLGPAIDAALRRRWHLRNGETATAFRCIHGAGDGLPGLYFDIYAEWGLVHIRSETCADREAEIVATLSELPLRGLYIKRRPRQANEMSPEEIAARAPEAPIVGEAAPNRFDVWEHDVRYRASLCAGMSTGLFVDQRRNRAWLRRAASGKRVLNLFSYTCGFAAAALRGGAREVINIDAAKSVLQWGEENLESYERSRWKNYPDDVFEYLRRAQRRDETFDIIVVDPPTYSTTKSSRFRSGKDWQQLVALAALLLTPRGLMLCCSNDERMSQEAFRKHVRAGLARHPATQRANVRDRRPAKDVRGHLGAGPQLKTVEVSFSSASKPRTKGQKRRAPQR